MKTAMRWLPIAILSLAAVARAAEPGGIVVLGAAGERARERILVDTLRIYTRDLGRNVHLGGAAPASLATEELARVADVAARAGDDIVVWFGARGGAPVLLALRVATLDLRETPVTGEPLDSARTLALKVRALCTPSPAPPEWTTPPEAPTPRAAPAPPATTTPPTTTPPTPTPSTPTPTPPTPMPPTEPRPSPTTSAQLQPSPATTVPPPQAPAATEKAEPPKPATIAQATSRPRQPVLELDAQYTLIVPTTAAWLRQGLVVRLAFPFGRVPLEAFADAAFTSAPALAVDANSVSARVWPVAVGLAFRLARPRWRFAIGPRASLQIVDASARTPDGHSGSATAFSAGLGLLGEGAWMFSRHVGLVASVTAEALVPRQQLVAGPGPGATDLGWAQFGFSAGFVVSIP